MFVLLLCHVFCLFQLSSVIGIIRDFNMSFALKLSKGAKNDAAKQALAQQVLALLFAGTAEEGNSKGMKEWTCKPCGAPKQRRMLEICGEERPGRQARTGSRRRRRGG